MAYADIEQLGGMMFSPYGYGYSIPHQFRHGDETEPSSGVGLMDDVESGMESLAVSLSLDDFDWSSSSMTTTTTTTPTSTSSSTTTTCSAAAPMHEACAAMTSSFFFGDWATRLIGSGESDVPTNLIITSNNNNNNLNNNNSCNSNSNRCDVDGLKCSAVETNSPQQALR